MANVDKLDGRKGRRSDNKTETGKADTLNFALTAGAVGLGLALIDLKEAAAAATDSKSAFERDDDRRSDSSADQAMSGIDHSRAADHHDNRADGGPAVASGGETGAQAPGVLSSETSPVVAQEAPESASSLAAADDALSGNTVHDAGTVIASVDTGISTAAVHTNSEEVGAFEGVHGTSSVISSVVETAAPSGGALGGAGALLETVDHVASNLLGNGGVLDIAPVIGDTVHSLVGKDGVLGGLVGEHDGDVLAGLADTGSVLVEGLAGKGGTLDGLVGNGDGGILSALVGGHGGILSGLLGAGSGAAAGEVATTSDNTASTQGASTQNIATTGAQAHVDSAAPSNMFEMAHSALQITEGVADAITPILTFVGQPIIEDDAHTDTDHASSVSAHHIA